MRMYYTIVVPLGCEPTYLMDHQGIQLLYFEVVRSILTALKRRIKYGKSFSILSYYFFTNNLPVYLLNYYNLQRKQVSTGNKVTYSNLVTCHTNSTFDLFFY